MKVFRIESARGIGPYRHYTGGKLSNAHNWDSTHPTVREVPGFDSDLHHCCFNSLRQFRDWFQDEDLDLIKGKMYLVEYECQEEFVIQHTKQCVFERCYAHKVSKILLTEWRANEVRS